MKNKIRLIVALTVIIVGCFLWLNYSTKEKKVELILKSDLTESNYKGKIKSIKRIINDGDQEYEHERNYFMLIDGKNYPHEFFYGASSYQTFNNDGNILSKYNYSRLPAYLDENGKRVFKELLDSKVQYDDKGNKVSVDNYTVNHSPKESKLFSREVFEYNNNGDIVKQISSFYDDYPERKEDTIIIYFTYDENGNKVKEEKEYEYLGEKTKSQINFEYDKNGNEINQIRYYSSGEVGSVKKSEYDFSGNLISTEELEIGSPSRSERIIYQYDGDDNIIMITYYYGYETLDSSTIYSEKSWKLSSTSQKRYDKNGNEVINMMTDHEGNLSFISYSEYDENDYLISNIVVDPLTDPQNIEDCGVRPWVYNFKYDNLGNCIEEKFYLGESYAQKTEWIYEYYD